MFNSKIITLIFLETRLYYTFKLKQKKQTTNNKIKIKY